MIIKKYSPSKSLVRVASLAIVAGMLAAPGISSALAVTASATTSTSNSNTSTNASVTAATQAQRLATIKAKGAAEIARRLTLLNIVAGKINSNTELTASDKAYLAAEVSAEITGLTALQAKLAADTTVSEASADAQSIFTEYRVFALVVPKVWLVKTADDQQITEGDLTTLAGKLQARITADKTADKDVTTLQLKLNYMIAQTNDAQAISSSIEQKVLTLQPSDYDSDHAILSGDLAQLKAAHADNVTAAAEAKVIISGLQSL